MLDKPTVIAMAVALAAPFVLAGTGAADGVDDNATWGLCTADEVNEQGDEASGGAVGETSPFSNLTDEDCENATAPWEGTPGEDHVPEDPDDEGERGDDGDRGDDESPDDPGRP